MLQYTDDIKMKEFSCDLLSVVLRNEENKCEQANTYVEREKERKSERVKQPSVAYQNSCHGNFFSQVSFYEDELERII
jgi:hypothetical protein